jgi:hypothetical protein
MIGALFFATRRRTRTGKFTHGVRVQDLKDQINTPHPRTTLHCFECGQSFSAHRGDYFAADPEHLFICCDKPMQLVVKRTQYVGVGQ